MIRRSAPKETKVYHDDMGLFGKLTGKVASNNIDLLEVEFANFYQYCHRKSLMEVEGCD